MSCYHPKKGFYLGLKDNGKKDIRITSYNTLYVLNHEGEPVTDFYRIPCGHCIGCYLDYARQWAIRCMLESSYYDSNYFVTLTYDDEHNPRNLIKSDLQVFIKKLRTYLERAGKPSPRFFAAGEYGSLNLRPHFHLILFNLELDDLIYFKSSKSGEKLFHSAFLSNIWNKGFVEIGTCTFKSCGYVARYCCKGLDHHELEKLGFNKEFVLMSRRPGIGFGYFNDNYESMYKTDKLYFDLGDNDKPLSIPHYFDYLMNKLDPVFIQQIKNVRSFKTNMNFFQEFLHSTLSSEEKYLQIKEESKLKKINFVRSRSYA